MNSAILLKTLLATLLIFTLLEVMNNDKEKEVVNLYNQLTCQDTVDMNTETIVPHSCKEIKRPSSGEFSPYSGGGSAAFITSNQIRTIRTIRSYFPHR